MVVQNEEDKLLSSNDEGRTLDQPQIKSLSHSKPLFFVTTLFPLRALHSIPHQHRQEPRTVLVQQRDRQFQGKVGNQTRTTRRFHQSTPDVVRSQHERRLSTMLKDALRPGHDREWNRHLPQPRHSLGGYPVQIQTWCRHHCRLHVSRTQELLTKIRTICVEIRDIKRTSQKQYIKTPFKGQDRDNLRTTGRNYSNPPHKEEEQDGKPDCSHTASTSSSLASPPTDNSDSRRHYAGEEASSPAAYPSALPSPSPPHATPPDSLSPSGDTSEPADEDLKGYTIGPCSAGIQMDTVLEG